jgi:hypothetical protein
MRRRVILGRKQSLHPQGENETGSWFMLPSNLVDRIQSFGGNYCVYLEGDLSYIA